MFCKYKVGGTRCFRLKRVWKQMGAGAEYHVCKKHRLVLERDNWLSLQRVDKRF
jgi:hypothetical protein